MASGERLIDALERGFERDLLLIGVGERPPVGARERVMASALTGTGATLTVGAIGSKPGTMLGVVAKWLTLGAVAAGLPGPAGVVATESHTTSTAQVSAQTLRLPQRSVWKVTEDESSLTVAPSSEPPRKVRARKAPSGAVWIGPPEVTLEGQSLERVRALANRDPKRALALLDEHDRQFAQGGMRRESLALRARIIVKSDPESPPSASTPRR